MARIAFIGLGHMGGGMAPNLAKAGHEVRAFDLVAEAVQHASEGGCTPASSAAEAIAGMAPLAAIANKEMINAAFEMPLSQGIRFERRLFHGLFGTEDQKEGMAAFVEKRPGNWKGR